ncbi:MAG: hypothetical protein ABL883_11670 [Terricaulis sp.]
MLSRIFPRRIDNSYQGHVVAVWLFAPVVLLKTVMGFNVAGLNPWVTSRYILQSADGVPVDSFSAYGASVVVFMFASWGLGLLILALLSIVVLIRYRAMLPLMILVMTLEQIGRKGIALINPILSSGDDQVSTGFWINWALSAALLLSLALSVLKARRAPTSG